LKKCRSHLERGFFAFWRGFGEGTGLKKPVTESKRSQNQKRPPLHSILPNGCNIFENALAIPPAAYQFTEFSCSTISEDQSQTINQPLKPC
jgi:hypothetical protein